MRIAKKVSGVEYFSQLMTETDYKANLKQTLVLFAYMESPHGI